MLKKHNIEIVPLTASLDGETYLKGQKQKLIRKRGATGHREDDHSLRF